MGGCVVRLPLYPIYTAENVGFRCVEPITPPPVMSSEGGEEAERRRAAAREPKRHRLAETWKYKVKQAFSNMIIGRNRITRSEEL